MDTTLITSELVDAYCNKFSSPESPLLAQLSAETPNHFTGAHMISGAQVGGLLKMLVQLKQPKLVLDIGTYTGYSAICMGLALPEDGRIITIDKYQIAQDFAQKFFDQTEFAHKVEARNGYAIEIIEAIEGDIDFVFLDADKINYVKYYELCLSKMKPGSMIVADNTLWRGEVANAEHDKTAARVHAYNAHVAADARVSQVLLPIRDGVSIAVVV